MRLSRRLAQRRGFASACELVDLTRAQISNSTPITEISAIHKENQLDGILVNMCRAR